MNIVTSSDETFWKLWHKLRITQLGRTALYGHSFIEYLLNYPEPWQPEDDFCVIFLDSASEPMAGVLASVKRARTDQTEISSFGYPIQVFYNPQTSINHRKKIAKIIWNRILHWTSKYRPTYVIYRNTEYFNDPLLNFFLKAGASCTPMFVQRIDLLKSESEIWSNLRDTHKRYIRWGLRNLDIRIYDHSSLDLTEEYSVYRSLHLLTAGRQTRSDQTWDIYYRMIKDGQAFMVTARIEGETVTASLFSVGYGSCYYSSGASRRDLFDMPLNHAVMWKAILYSKELGMQTFEVGEIPYPQLYRFVTGNVCTPTDKEVSIGFYKEGFGGKKITHLDIMLLCR